MNMLDYESQGLPAVTFGYRGFDLLMAVMGGGMNKLVA